MINGLESSLFASPLAATNTQQATDAHDLDWSRYVQGINDFIKAPPKEYEVTIPLVPWYRDVEIPAWQIPDLMKQGINPSSLAPSHNARIRVTEGYLKILKDSVPTYVSDITEIDPITGKPLPPPPTPFPGPQKVTQALAINSSASTPDSAAPFTLAPVPTQDASPAYASPADRPINKTEPVPPSDTASADFDNLPPEVQQAALSLAGRFLREALRRLLDSDRFDALLANGLDRRA